MAKTFFSLGGEYQGKRVRRLSQFGRVVLYRVVRDTAEIIQADYWLVHIEGFTEERDRSIIRRISRHGNGWFRFVRFQAAQAVFAELCSAPEYGADELKRQNSLSAARSRIRTMLDSGKLRKNAPRAGK
jgi:hypothetical protein